MSMGHCLAMDQGPRDEATLDELLTRPSEALAAEIAAFGDIVVLGAGGKMGPTLCRLARRAQQAAGAKGRVVALSRFRDEAQARALEAAAVEVVRVDLLDPGVYAGLPDAGSVVYMVGQKFGTSGDAAGTWATNAAIAAWASSRYRGVRTVAFSTGNVYPLRPLAAGGADEATAPAPVGEYAQSCLGRERLFEYAAKAWGTPVVLVRLNYAVDLRYGVLVDIARAVREGREVDLAMGLVNVIWQGDACEVALRALALAASPARALNVTGPETASVRALAERFGRRFGRAPLLLGEEGPTALLSDAGRACARFGYPRVPLARLADWTADWLEAGGRLLDKPTHFSEREGRF